MKRILLVGENGDVTDINQAVLLIHGYEVQRATAIKEAEEALAVSLPDLMVVDVDALLPRINCLDFCGKAKINYTLPLILLSEKGEAKDILTGFNAGADDYIVKPYDLEVFLAKIEAKMRIYQRD